MQELTRKRIMRKLDALPDAQLYQVLDFIEFLERKHAPNRAVAPNGLERFAERLEDGMRARAVTAGVMTRTMRVLGTASRVVDGVTAFGRELLQPRQSGADTAVKLAAPGDVREAESATGHAGAMESA